MQNKAFSKIWIIIILIILIGGGYFSWQYLSELKDGGKNGGEIGTWLPLPEITEEWQKKMGDGFLLVQIEARKDYLVNPTPEKMKRMKGMNIRTENMNMHRIFIYTSKELTKIQVDELKVMGIVLYLDSWIPLVGAHPYGFIIADMPINKLEELAKKEYIIRLNTAESEPLRISFNSLNRF